MITIENIRDNYSPEMALVIMIARVHFKTATAHEVNLYVSDNTIDWSLFSRIIAAHQIRPIIHNIVSGHAINIDAVAKDNLHKTCLRIARNNLEKLAELVRLLKVFNKKGLRIIPYKGVVLSKLLFDDFVTRETSDIDFIVQPQDFASAYQVLIDNGYVPGYYYSPAHQKHFLRTDNELLFHRKTENTNFNIEMHWAITHRMMDIPMQNDYLFLSTDKAELLGEEYEVFNIQNHLLGLLVHHGVNDIWRTLRHNLDISLLLQRYSHQVNWDEVDVVTRVNKLNKSTAIGFVLSNTLFGTPIPETFRGRDIRTDRVIGNLLRFPAIKRKKLSLENIVQQFRLRDSVKDKLSLSLAYINAAFMPNMRDIQAVQIPSRFYFFYYFIKPFRLLFRRSAD